MIVLKKSEAQAIADCGFHGFKRQLEYSGFHSGEGRCEYPVKLIQLGAGGRTEQLCISLYRKLLYKAKKFGCELIIADSFYPSSKICSHCGHRKHSLSLSERIDYWENRGFDMDRDVNAAIYLSRLAKA